MAIDWAAEIAGKCLGRQVRVLNRVVTGIFDQALAPHGLRMTQMTLLVAIARLQPVHAAAVGRRLHIEKSTLSRNLARMEEHGWIRSRGGLRLTARGRRLIDEAGPAWAEAQEETRCVLGHRGAATLGALVARLTDA